MREGLYRDSWCTCIFNIDKHFRLNTSAKELTCHNSVQITWFSVDPKLPVRYDMLIILFHILKHTLTRNTLFLVNMKYSKYLTYNS